MQIEFGGQKNKKKTAKMTKKLVFGKNQDQNVEFSKIENNSQKNLKYCRKKTKGSKKSAEPRKKKLQKKAFAFSLQLFL